MGKCERSPTTREEFWEKYDPDGEFRAMLDERRATPEDFPHFAADRPNDKEGEDG